jgi:predicted CXXCH cytochrome family protein
MSILVLLALVVLPLSLQAFDFQACDDCHEETLWRASTRFYLHSPFAEQQCAECHAAAESSAPAVKMGTTVLSDQQKINWLGASDMVDTSHAFLLPAVQVAAGLIVELQGTDGRFSRRQIAVPPLAGLAEVEDSGKPPAISGVQVVRVKRGVFLSATIRWQTDTLTNAAVYYGTQDISQTSGPSNRLGRQHEVILYGLKPDQTYRYSVVSTDLFGRRQAFEILEFSTVNPYTAPLPTTSLDPIRKRTEAGLDTRFQRLGADYLLELKLAQPAAVYIGSRGASQQRLDSGSSSTSPDDEYHAGLSSAAVISIGACGSCHENQSVATHPVNVYPKPGMTIPPEYPTLADGRITCSSCHAPHGSDYLYLTRKSGKRELCVGCHLDML